MKNKPSPPSPIEIEKEANRALSKKAPSVVTYLGDPDRAITTKGDIVRRVPFLMIVTDIKDMPPSLHETVPYDNHFIYENPDTTLMGDSIVSRTERPVALGPLHLCTCGSIGVIVSGEKLPVEYFNKIACQYDALHGFKGEHQTTHINVKDFARIAQDQRYRQ